MQPLGNEGAINIGDRSLERLSLIVTLPELKPCRMAGAHLTGRQVGLVEPKLDSGEDDPWDGGHL